MPDANHPSGPLCDHSGESGGVDYVMPTLLVADVAATANAAAG